MIKGDVSKKRILFLIFIFLISAIGFQPVYADNEKIQQLIEDLKDEDSNVRQAAEKAIKKIEAKTR
ncbi:MAG: hypothetical protein ABIJ15_07885 [bacterium]